MAANSGNNSAPSTSSGTRLFKRGVKVTLITPSSAPGKYFTKQGGGGNAVEITQMRVKFKIERSVKSDPNKCELTIFNLNEATRTLCETKPLMVWIDAGYDGALRQVFSGDVRRAYSKLEKPLWSTVMSLADGDRAIRLARTNQTFAGGTAVSTIVKQLAGKLNLSVDAAALTIPGMSGQVIGPRVAQGSAAAELTRILAPMGVSWSIQNAKLVLLRDDDNTQGTAIVVQPDTGLIGTPEYTTPAKDGKPAQLKFKMLLYPQLAPGRVVQVASKSISKRLFRIQKVEHVGDTHGKEWFSEVEALPIDGAGVTT